MSEINFDFKKMYPFKWFILENYPFLEDSVDTLTNYQLFCKLGEEINKNRDAINDIGDNQEQVVEGYNILYHWFENLDVQEEINNKLDEMAQDGTLTDLISGYVTPLINAQNQEIQNFKDETTSDINQFKTQTNTTLTSFNNRLTSLTNQNPIPVDSTSDMTDTTKVYLNTSNGYWYYYDGANWTQGGLYQSTGISPNSVDILDLNQTLQANFVKDYSIVENPTHYTNYYAGVNSSNVVTITEHTNYAYDKYALTNQEIYLVTGGVNRSSVVGIIVADSSGNVIYSTKPQTPSNDPILQSLFFKANGENLYLYVSYDQANTSNYNRLNFHQVYKLTNLYMQDNFNFNADLLYTYQNAYGAYASGQLNPNNGSTARVYNMQKGRNYTLTAQNRLSVAGIIITNYDMNDPLYISSDGPVGTRDVDVTYTFTAPKDGLIILSTATDSNLYSITVNKNIIEDNQLVNKTISCDGDSIMKGNENSNTSYYNLIATKFGMQTQTNNSQGGATIATGTQSSGVNRHWISSGVNDISTASDYILINGGFNDYANKVPLGEITETFSDTIDSRTFAGGMELLCRNLLTRFTNGQKILFVFNHNINATWYTKNSSSNGHTFEEYYNIQIAVLKKYGIPYIDLIHESQFNTILDTYKNNYTVDSDGVHPTTTGYNKFYIDKISSKMKLL